MLEISDGFNFTIGEILANLVMLGVAVGVGLVITAIIYVYIFIMEWIERRQEDNEQQD